MATTSHKEGFWLQMGVQGRLGLFHYEQRVIRTLRKQHVDYSQAITDLLSSIYSYYVPNYEKLLKVLKSGKMSSSKGKKYSSEDIAEMKRSKVFRERYDKYLHKVIHEPQTIRQNLDDWFCKHKATSSDPTNKPAGGRLDPVRMITLFTVDTKTTLEACKDKAQYLSDPLPLDQMYDKILPNPNSSHQLTEFLSKRGESKLEAFHDRLAHFANCGMRSSLADNLNLAGTARFNISIHHKRSLVTTENPPEKQLLDRKSIPVMWERVVPYYNHSELWHVNNMSKSVGSEHPFPGAEILPKSNGEKFFSNYITTFNNIGKEQRGPASECLCQDCQLCCHPIDSSSANPTTSTQAQQQKQQQQRSIAVVHNNKKKKSTTVTTASNNTKSPQ